MKRFLLALSLLLIINTLPAYAIADISLELNQNEHDFAQRVLDSTYESQNKGILISEVQNSDDSQGGFLQNIQNESQSEILNHDPSYGAVPNKFFLYDVITKTAKNIHELEVDNTNTVVPLLKDQLTFKPEAGPLEKLHIWSAYQMNFSTVIPEKGDTDSKFDMGLINILIDGTFRGGKEEFRIMLDPTHRHSHPSFMQPFFQDLYIESSRIPHTKVLIGNSRPGVGVEGAQSPYTLSFINRSQISRNFANARKFGVRVRGDYSLMDYDTGFYSSSTNFTDFFPGYEYDGWMNVKPLGKTDGRYGKLVTGAGIQSGEKHGMSYYLTSTYAGYEYKKFWTKFEYGRANGSNGSTGLSNKRAQGLFWTVGYHVTKKLELLARFDHFDPDRTVKGNNKREYTLGTNYYLKGQAMKLIFNYIYCQNDSSVDSHKLMVGTQIVL